MLDHLGIDVSDYDRSKAFYTAALKPLGLEVLMEPVPNACGFGDPEKRMPFFWLYDREDVNKGVHVAFSAPDRATVDAFHARRPGGRRHRQRRARRPRDLPPQLLRGVRAGPRRKQRRGRLSHARLSTLARPCPSRSPR